MHVSGAVCVPGLPESSLPLSSPCFQSSLVLLLVAAARSPYGPLVRGFVG